VIIFVDQSKDLEIARMVTFRVIARDATDLGKDTLAEAFEGERVQAPQYFPSRSTFQSDSLISSIGFLCTMRKNFNTAMPGTAV
jgi:hypothetical protein